jgi:arylsulfatase A-like enzyme
MKKSGSLQRREFLKLASLAPLAAWGPTRLDAITAMATGPQPVAAPANQKVSTPNILVVVFDALSAQNMSLYGYPRQTTPNLERLSQRAIVYHRHFASGNFTSPGTASLLTGLYPWTHRSLHLRSEVLARYAGQNIFNQLPAAYRRFAYTQNPFAYVLLNQFRHGIDTLEPIGDLAEFDSIYSEKLFDNDYFPASEAELSQFKEEFKLPGSLLLSLLERLRIGQGNRKVLGQYQGEYPRGLVNCRTSNPGLQCFRIEPAIDWTIAQAQIASAGPFFGYVHYFPPHAPYNPTLEYTRLFNDDFTPPEKPPFSDNRTISPANLHRQRRQYDQSIATIDAEFARLYDTLEKSGALQNTLLVFTSDHGELLERGIAGHSTSALYQPITHIPLLIFPPGQQTRIDVTTPTSAVDVAPTLLSLAGSQPPAGTEGQLLPEFSAAAAADRPVYTVEAKRNPKTAPLTRASLAIVRWPYELVRYTGYADIPDSEELYDLENDPEELHNLYEPGNPVARALGDELDAQLNAVGASPR